MELVSLQRARDDGLFCGDQFTHWLADGKLTLCMVDGLGSGEPAEIAAKAALDYVAKHPSKPPKEVISECNKAIRHTRGVALAIAVLDMETNVMSYGAVGNIHGMYVGEKTIRFSSTDGTVGDAYKTFLLEQIPLEPDDLVILYTDGIKQLIDTSRYGNLRDVDISSLAEVIIQDSRIEIDDAAIAIFRNERTNPDIFRPVQSIKSMQSIEAQSATQETTPEKRKTICIDTEEDILSVRTTAGEMAGMLGFSVTKQQALMTATSELVRNVIRYASQGKCIISDGSDQKMLRIKVIVEDHGPGISDLDQAMKGGFSTSDGLGQGLSGTKALVDQMSIETKPGSTKVTIVVIQPKEV